MKKLIFCTLLTLSTLALAQVNTGKIIGTIVDPNGAAVPGASVTITNENKGYSQTTDTDSTGTYVFPFVEIGDYTVRILREGFRSSIRNHVSLDVGQVLRLDTRLQLGEVKENVVVTGEAPLLQTDSSSVEQVISNRMVSSLPLNGRDFAQLASVGANTTGTGTLFIGATTRRLSLNGNRPENTEFMLDGASNTETTYNGVRTQPSLDAIQEFKVESNSFSAVQGRGSALINVALKSGQNSFHGSAYEFFRNDKLDATHFFSTSKPPLRQNQFGFTLGGPVLKNRVFFFGDYDGSRLRVGQTIFSHVASAAERAGDFSSDSFTIYDPLTIRPDPNNPGQVIKDPFPGNQIPANRISGPAQYFLPFIPLPNAPGNFFSFNPSNPRNEDRGDGRVDYIASETNSFFGRYSIADTSYFFAGQQPIHGGFTYTGRSQNAMLSFNHSFSARTLNLAQLTYSRLAYSQYPQGLGTNHTELSGIQGWSLLDKTNPGFPTLVPFGYLGITGGFATPIEARINNWEISDKVSLIRGPHQLTVGFDTYKTSTPTSNSMNDRGFQFFNGQFSGNQFADFLLGYPSGLNRGFPNATFGTHSISTSFFTQDDWAVNKKLTLHLGLRYDLLFPPSFIRGQASSFDYYKTTRTPGSLIIANDSSGNIDKTAQPAEVFFLPKVSDILVTARQAGLPDNLVRMDWNNVAPRFGLAWRPYGDKTVIRAGIGVYYLMTQGLRYLGESSAAPFQVNESFFFSNATAPQATWADPNFLPPFGSNFGTVGFVTIDPNARTPYLYQWNFAVQRELTKSITAEASYSGASDHKLENTRGLNIPDPAPGPPAFLRRPVPRFGVGGYMGNFSNANYNGLRLRLEQRTGFGLSFLATYVYGKSLDYASFEPGNFYTEQDPNNLRAQYGRSDYDLRHTFVGSYIYELPFGKGRRVMNRGGVANAVLGGWNVAGIVTFRSGLPFTPIIFEDIANTGTSQRPDRVCSGKLDHPTWQHWFDTSCFKIPQPFTYGNSGRNILDQPGLANWDFAVHKEFPIREFGKLAFRAEFFNFTNTTHLGGQVGPTFFSYLNTGIDGFNPGLITSAGDPREIQLGLKFMF